MKAIEQFNAKDAENNLIKYQAKEEASELNKVNLYDINDILEAIKESTAKGNQVTNYDYKITKNYDPEDFFGKVGKLKSKGFQVSIGAKDSKTQFMRIFTPVSKR